MLLLWEGHLGFAKKPGWLYHFVTKAVITTDMHYALSAYIKPKFHAFLTALSTAYDLILFQEAVKEAKWCSAMNAALEALELNHTWKITSLPPRRKAIGYKWLYKTKFNLDSSINKYKARLDKHVGKNSGSTILRHLPRLLK